MPTKASLTDEEQRVVEAVKKLVAEHGTVEVGWDDPVVADHFDVLRKSKVRRCLVKGADSIVVDIYDTTKTVRLFAISGTHSEGRQKERGKKRTSKKKIQHTYIKPRLHQRMKKLIQSPSSLVVCGVGPTGCGKTTHMRLMAEELNMELELINCKRDMDTASFIGEKTIEVDEKTEQSIIKFLEGPVIRAMKCGLDEKGNEVGNPALLVVDEFPMIPSWIAIGLNNLLDNFSPRRQIRVDADGARVVTSHSGFRIVLLGNTIGRGILSTRDAGYVAQGDALDDSTLDRIDAIFHYGYNRRAEESILREKIGNDSMVRKLLRFRDAIRNLKRQGEVTTPFSTRLIVSVCDLYREYDEDIAWALHDAVFGKLVDDSPDPNVPGGELAVYNEQAMQIFGIDVLKSAADDSDMDYV